MNSIDDDQAILIDKNYNQNKLLINQWIIFSQKKIVGAYFVITLEVLSSRK